MVDGDGFERRLLLAIDARGYGGSTARRQGDMQDGLLSVVTEAADMAGLNRPEWRTQEGGDGELAVLPAGEPETRVVDGFVRCLHAALRRYNRERTDEARLRLRLAIHFGLVGPGPNGPTGDGPVAVSRLCDSRQLKAALAYSRADLAVMLSDHVYTDTVAAQRTSLDPAEFRGEHVAEKEFDGDAWVWIPDRPIPPGTPAGTPDRREPDPAAPPAAGPRIGDVGSGNVGSGNIGIAGGVGRDVVNNVTMASRPTPEKVLEEGRMALTAKRYGYAAERISEAIARAEAVPPDTHFSLALAVLAGKPPQLQRRPVIQRADDELQRELDANRQHVGARVLRAILKYDYYAANGYSVVPPAPEQLLAEAEPYVTGEDSRDQLERIRTHVPGRDTPVWRWLLARVGAA